MHCDVNFIVSAFIKYEKFMKAFLWEFPGGIPRLRCEGASLYETRQGRVFSEGKFKEGKKKRDETSKKLVAVPNESAGGTRVRATSKNVLAQ